MALKKSVWMGARPTHCDLCGDPLIIEFVDGRTRSGQWGILCRPCHAEQGVGVGLGKGQVYNLGTLEKVEG